ncbi:hypothetical protein OZX65_00960 [Leuconostocaceae bacterium ESL0723]|nr:hypothetical protein OZX65_00960 [Leuconostocaceae bacterium ESL0723]
MNDDSDMKEYVPLSGNKDVGIRVSDINLYLEEDGPDNQGEVYVRVRRVDDNKVVWFGRLFNISDQGFSDEEERDLREGLDIEYSYETFYDRVRNDLKNYIIVALANEQ